MTVLKISTKSVNFCVMLLADKQTSKQMLSKHNPFLDVISILSQLTEGKIQSKTLVFVSDYETFNSQTNIH